MAVEDEVALVVEVAPVAVRPHVVADHAVVGVGIGRSGDDVHLVAKAGKLTRQVVGVDSLATRVPVALVHDEGDPHTTAPRKNADS